MRTQGAAKRKLRVRSQKRANIFAPNFYSLVVWHITAVDKSAAGAVIGFILHVRRNDGNANFKVEYRNRTKFLLK